MSRCLRPRIRAALLVMPILVALLVPVQAAADVSISSARVDVKAKRITLSVFCPGAGGAGCAGTVKVRAIRHPKSSDTELLQRLAGDPAFGTSSPLLPVRNLQGTFESGEGTIPLNEARKFNRELREAAQDDLVVLEAVVTPAGAAPEVEVVELWSDNFVVERERDKPVKATYTAQFDLKRTINWSSTSEVKCWSGGAFRSVGTSTSSGTQKIALGTREPTLIEVQSYGEGRPWFQPELPIVGSLTAHSSTTDNTTAKCDAVGDGGDGAPYVPPPPDCGTRPVKPTTLKLEYARPQELSIGMGLSSAIEPQTPFNRCVIIPSERLARSSVDLPEAWLLPELNRCRRAAKSSARAGSSPLIVVVKGGTRLVCRDRAAEVAACHEAARGGSSPLFPIVRKGNRRVRYVCREGSPHKQGCESANGVSSPLLPIDGKPRRCADKDKSEMVCETSLRARGSQAPVFVAHPLGPCKFRITRTSWRRFGTPGGYNGTVSTTWTLTLAPKKVPVG